MKTTIKLAGWYGIGTREVEVTATASRDGILVRAYLPAEDAWTLDGEVAQRTLSWDEVESAGSADTAIRGAALDLAHDVVQAALPTKKPGEVYSDGTY